MDRPAVAANAADSERNAASRRAWNEAVRRVAIEEADFRDRQADSAPVLNNWVQQAPSFSNATFNKVLLAVTAIGIAVIASGYFIVWQPVHTAAASNVSRQSSVR